MTHSHLKSKVWFVKCETVRRETEKCVIARRNICVRVPVRLYVKEAIRARSLGILLIDDDQDFTALVRSVLEGKGYGVLELHSGTQGLSKVAEQKPDAAEEHDE